MREGARGEVLVWRHTASTSPLPRPTLRLAAPSSAKAVMCCGPSAPSTAPTASGACACRCTAVVSCALPVAPGATWIRPASAGVRNSSARQPSHGPPPAASGGSANGQPCRPSRARQQSTHRHRLARSPRGRTWRNSLLRSGRPAGQPWRSVPAAAWYSPGPGAAVRRGLCGAGRLAAYSAGLAWRSRGLSPHDAGRAPRESLRPRGGYGGAGAQGEAP